MLKGTKALCQRISWEAQEGSTQSAGTRAGAWRQLPQAVLQATTGHRTHELQLDTWCTYLEDEIQACILHGEATFVSCTLTHLPVV